MNSAALAATLQDAPAWRAALTLAMPFAFAAACVAIATARPSHAAAWSIVRIACAIGIATAMISAAAFIVAGKAVLQALPGSAVSVSLRVDAAGSATLLLVAFVGWVIAGYSQRCLEGGAGQRRYAIWLMATLAGVGGVIVANDLLALAACWMLASAALQRLLLFYPSRLAARMAAHRKLIANRVSELCLFIAIGLLWLSLDTQRIDAILAHPAITGAGDLPLAVQAATVLIVLAVLLKCALLPFHGWLIQVMEAPTPVSALLHAGVVNLGGFVLIRLAGLLDAVPAAQVLLVAAGTATAVLAALVMTTRISIKVSLAWSTCAQMGFMLMQVGLGAYAMALLHLVAHSLYKAHAFLSSGDLVRLSTSLALADRTAPDRLGTALAAALAAAGLMAGAQLAWATLHDAPGALDPAQVVLAAIACLVLAPLLTSPGRRGPAQALLLLLGAGAVALVHAGLHPLGAAWIPGRVDAATPLQWLLAAVVLGAFATLYLLQSVLRAEPGSEFARRLHRWFYAGLFLDERVARIGFRAWPLHLQGNRT